MLDKYSTIQVKTCSMILKNAAMQTQTPATIHLTRILSREF